MPSPYSRRPAPVGGRIRQGVLVLLTIALAALGLTAISSAAQADGPPRVTVATDGPAKFWTGVVRANGPTIRGIPECRTVNCDHLELKVMLPSGIWNRPGGVQVAIRWDIATEGALSLFVYRGGQRVATSAAGVGIAQSLTIPSAKNGTYDVYVSYGVTFGAVDPDPVIQYEGLAEVEYKPAVLPLRDLVPDLAALPQENVTYDNPGSIFGDTAQPGQSCFDSELDPQHPTRQCLRFDQVMRNAGQGPLELRFNRQIGDLGDQPVAQRVYRSDGAFRDIPAGQVEFHPIHDHYHFKDFAQSVLWHADSAGHPAGTAPAAVGDKVSFCVSDTDLIAWGVKGDDPLSYPAPDCLFPKQTIGNTEFFWYGISRGWADRYNWYLPGQMIDTAGLSDGTYVLFTTVDPINKLLESDDTNNCASVIVELTGLSTSQPHASRLGTGPSCPS
ncbi:MAG TPA: lysyl oxidase family protein [Actinomycetes bacterium]|nr:lysyl oxidase family protein [Actinomycetes bacterium]